MYLYRLDMVLAWVDSCKCCYKNVEETPLAGAKIYLSEFTLFAGNFEKTSNAICPRRCKSLSRGKHKKT